MVATRGSRLQSTVIRIGGQWFSSLGKEAGGTDPGVRICRYGGSPTCPVAGGVRPRARSSPLCDPPWPGGGSGQEEVSGGCSDVDHVFHNLHCCSGDEAPGYDA